MGRSILIEAGGASASISVRAITRGVLRRISHKEGSAGCIGFGCGGGRGCG